jgi:hypothetical protein
MIHHDKILAQNFKRIASAKPLACANTQTHSQGHTDHG